MDGMSSGVVRDERWPTRSAAGPPAATTPPVPGGGQWAHEDQPDDRLVRVALGEVAAQGC
jgi:hypothetical protein